MRESSIFKFDFSLPKYDIVWKPLIIILLINSGVGEYQSYIYLYGGLLFDAAPSLVIIFNCLEPALLWERLYLYLENLMNIKEISDEEN